MTPQELKNSILQLAIQGKLVEQRAEEGTAAELLEKIFAAKNAKGAKKNLTQRRRARGENKTSATSATSASPREKIPDDEKPFDIPESWEWVRLGDVVSLLSGRDLEPSEYSATPKKYPYMTGASNFANGILLVNRWTDRPVTISHIGDLLITCKGTVGAMAFNAIGDIHIARQIMAISSASIDLHYVKVFLAASVQSLKAAANSMIPGIDRKTMLFRPIPLPPLAEQKRIVAKIEELLPLIDRYEKAWSKLEDFNKRFPVDMQKSLLQMAIQGKLVEQRAEEGTAAELLEKILAAKNAKGAKKNLTRGRGARGEKETSALSAPPREEIPDDEKPFDIPESWEWVRLGEVALKVTDGTHKTPRYTERGIRFLSAKDICGERLSFDKCRFISEEEHHELFSRCNPEKGDLLVSKSGSIGSVALVEVDFEFSLFESLGLIKYDQTRVSPQYLQRAVQVACLCLNPERVRGVAVKHLPIADIKALPIPLPPLAEQKRIVAKLEELLPLCERLKLFEEENDKKSGFTSQVKEMSKITLELI